jgi:hypothetical protein
VITRKLEIPPRAASFVLGASKIVVPAGNPCRRQVERTVRDWLSYQLSWDEQDAPVAKDALYDMARRCRLRDLLDAAPVDVYPLTGSLAVRSGGRWLGADGNGVFRYEILDDKIHTRRRWPGTTSRSSWIPTGFRLWSSPRDVSSVSLVVGCGDYPTR